MRFNRKPYTDIALLLCLTLLLAQTASAQTPQVFEGNSWSKFPGGAKAVCADNDIDNDNDGLIELCYLENVDAIRNNTGGTGSSSDGCPSSGCNGYELVRDLDFTEKGSYSLPANKKRKGWTTGSGWEQIGDFSNPFNSIFEGNGHTISNLMINRSGTQGVGLFGRTNSSSKISNIGLLNVQIDGDFHVGGLVGQNNGSIANSYATGSVAGSSYVGGLVGLMNSGSITTNTYATGFVRGERILGGLVGQNVGSITNSYATGSVEGKMTTVGGLIGWNVGDIKNSYATGFVMGINFIGGLIGFKNAGDIASSYWDTSTTRISTSAGSNDSDGKTTVELQSPITAIGIYSMWNTDNWDFGTSSQYPILKYAQDCGESQQPDCDALIGRQRNNQPAIKYPTTKTEILITSNDAGTIKTIPVTVSDVDVNDKLTLLLSADEGQNLVVSGTTKAEVLPNGSITRDEIDLRIRVPQTIIFGMTTLRLVAKDDSGLHNAMSEPVLFKVRVVANTPPTIESISSPIILPLGTTLNVVIQDADGDPISVRFDSDDSTIATATIVATDKANYTLTITALDAGTAVITVTASDDEGSSAEAMFTIRVDAEPSGEVTIDLDDSDDNAWQLEAISNVMDANGIDETKTSYQWFKNEEPQSETSNIYQISNDNSGRAAGTKYEVIVTYEDNIEQVTTFSAVYTIDNQAPVIKSVAPTKSEYEEGEQVSITANVEDLNRDRWDHIWSVPPGISAKVTKTDSQSRLNFDVPPDWIKDIDQADKTEPLQLEIAVTEIRSEGVTTTRTTSVVVKKINNIPSTPIRPTIVRDDDTGELSISEETVRQAIADDPDGNNLSAVPTYRWQRCQSPCSSATDIAGQVGTTYTPRNVAEGDTFRIKISYTDGQGYSNTIYSNALDPSSAGIRVRAKVFLEGPLQ